MRATLVMLAVAGAALVAATHASARQQACKPSTNPGVHRYCGPAKATLKVGGKKYVFTQGFCAIDGSMWTLNIGVTGTSKTRYFGITVFSHKAGKHDAAVSWQLRNRSHSLLKAKVTLARGLKKGTFTGSTGSGKGKGTGSFSCT